MHFHFVIIHDFSRKGMFYLTKHSTHFIYSSMVSDHSDGRGNPLSPLYGLLFVISSKGSFICTISVSIVHTTVFVTPVVEHWLNSEIAQLAQPWGTAPTKHHAMSGAMSHSTWFFEDSHDNIYCILRQEPLQKTLWESIFFSSPKLSCLVGLTQPIAKLDICHFFI